MNATTDITVLGSETEFPPRRRRKNAEKPAATTEPGADAPTSPEDELEGEEEPKGRKKGIREEDLGDPVRSRRDPFGHDLFGGGYGVW